jgi:DNA repair exonuclease SbcCD ATPase subunit
MNLKLKSIKFSGIQSFIGESVFNFPDGNGFNFIRGINKIENSLGSNGAGKSNFLDVICWTITGKSTRGLKAIDLKSWHTKDKAGYKSELVFTIDDNEHILFRSWNPNKITIDGIIVTQDYIDDLIGISFDLIIKVMIIAQFNVMFFGLNPTERLSMLDVLGLDYWDNLSKNASDEKKQYKQDLDDVESFKDRLIGRIEAKEDELKRVKDSNYKKKKESLKEKTSLKKDLKNCNTLCNKLLLVITKQKKILKKLKIRYEDLDSQMEIDSQALKDFEEKEDKYSKEKYAIEGEVKRINDLIIEFRTMKGGKTRCHKCFQLVSGGHANRTILEAKKDLSNLGDKYKKILIELHKWEDRYKQAKRSYLKSENEFNDLSVELSDKRHSIKAQKRELEIIDNDKNHIEKELESIIKTNKKDDKCLSNLLASIKKYESKLFVFLRNIQYIKNEIEGLGYWSKAFKDVKLLMIDEFLKDYQQEANNLLNDLGLFGWEIILGIDVETKTGKIKRGFQVSIKSPDNNKIVPWESWSGGESQRLCIIGNMALINTLLNKKGIDLNVEIWDEPSTYVGEEGIYDLIELLRQRSQNKQVWIIDHQMVEYLNFDNELTIIKTQEGSKLEFNYVR